VIAHSLARSIGICAWWAVRISPFMLAGRIFKYSGFLRRIIRMRGGEAQAELSIDAKYSGYRLGADFAQPPAQDKRLWTEKIRGVRSARCS
jgi:hypothetical protein